MSLPIKILGAPGSPYSRKLRSVLRYRRIPHVWIQRGSKHQGHVPKTPVSLIPILVFPGSDGSYSEAAIDTTPLIRRLEGEYKERSVIPPDPALAFIDALIEDYADEWLTKCMFHYRWAFSQDVEYASRVLPYWHRFDLNDEEIRPMAKQFADRQVERLWVVGSNETTGPVIEQSYKRLLKLLSERLEESAFVLGDRPSSCDFGLFGQLTQLIQVDPTPLAVARAKFHRVVAWLDLVEDLSGLEADESDWTSRDAISDRLRALLGELGRVYTPFLLANARALETGAEKVECEIDGRPWIQKPFPYQGKCLVELRKHYAGLQTSDRAIVDKILAGTGCEPLIS